MRTAVLFRCLLLACMLAGATGAAVAQTSIVATVNDEPISQYDVDQRAKFYALTSGTKKGANAFKERALEELVEELLMRQEMRRLAVNVPDEQVVAMIDQRLRPNKRDHAWFSRMLSSQGVRIATLENRLRVQIGWRSVIQRTYANLIDIGENEISAAIEEIDAKNEATTTVFNLKKVVLLMPGDANETAVAQRLEDAARIRRAFRDCRTAGLVTGRFRDIKIVDLAQAKVEEIEEPTRSLVQQAKANDMTPPMVTDAGVELVAVCSRIEDGGKREAVQAQLVSQEFGMLADRHLRDLKQDAVVDYR